MRNLGLFVLGLFLISALFRIDFFFYLLYICFGVYFLSRLWTERALRNLQLARDYTDRALLGEKVPVKVHLRNKGLLPLSWLRIHESLPIHLKSPNFFQSVVSLLPKEEAILSYELDCRRRGYYLLGPMVVSAGDLFGTESKQKELPELNALLVYPRIVPLTRLTLPSQTPFGSIASKQHIFEDPARMVGVRAYQSGDSLRHIHWKTTAATGVLQVKRFEPAISIESLIFLNLHRSAYTIARVETASELAIVTAASLANYLVAKRQTVGLSCNGFDPTRTEPEQILLPPHKGGAQLTRILDILARVQVSEQLPFLELLPQARLHLAWGGTAILITADADDVLFDRVLLMKRSGFHVMLIVMDPRTPFTGIQQRAQAVGVRAYQVWQESDLDVWR